MKIKLAILGSTGSIGKTLLEIIKKNKKNFEILLLTANSDYKKLYQQAKYFKVKNLIITNKQSYEILKNKCKKIKVKVFNSFDSFDIIFKKKKIDYVMSSIIGINGLEPTFKIIKHTKKIAIANKETIICGWNLIKKELNKHNSIFIPVDSEHFSLFYALRYIDRNTINKIFITASGGPFYNTPLEKFKNISISQALDHPSWKMGQKISIDSATMINKVYEVIEAKNIFNISYKKIKILVHPKSYIHSIIQFNDGMTKIIAHDTTMKVPILNSLQLNLNKKFNIFKQNQFKNLNLEILNNPRLKKLSPKRYPMIKLLKLLPINNSLYETVIVAANDTLVNLFLNKQIKFIEIEKKLFKFIKNKEFLNYKKKCPKNVTEILNLNNYVRLKIIKKSV